MTHHRVLGLLTLLVILAPLGVQAAPSFSSFSGGLTNPFGGRVYLTQIPTVTCIPPGTGPIVLSSNLAGATSLVSSSEESSGIGKLGSVVGGIYNMIPLYATDQTKTPQTGKWVLGRHKLIPDFTTCNSTALGGFPVPVKKMTIYGVSGGSSGFGGLGF